MKISSASSIIVALISCIGSSNFCSAVSFRGSIKDNTFAFEGEDQEGSQIGNFRSFFANPRPNPRPSPPPPRPNPRPSPPNPRPNPRPSPPPPRPNPRPSPPPPRPNPKPSPPPPSQKCYGHESTFYSGHEGCGPGVPQKQKGKMYLYAVPRCQSVELYDLDKVWGGAHISLGVWDEKQGIAKFNDLKKWLANTSQFKKGSSWHPTKSVLNPSEPKKLNCGLTWYKVHINDSKTLNKIRDHIQKYYAVHSSGPKPAMGTDLHITAVQSGSHNTAKLDGIKNVIIDSNVDWVVVLVKVVDKNGKTYIERQGEAKILATI